MSQLNATNGLKKPLEDWSQINWRKVHKLVRNLRQRIFLARKLGNFRKLRSLQRLMLRSHANLLLSVRRITQTNKGKATAGIDKEIVNLEVLVKTLEISSLNPRAYWCFDFDLQTPEQRVKLVNNPKGGTQSPTKRAPLTPHRGVMIPKPNGKQRPLGMPTVRDRIEQAIVTNTLEPECVVVFEPNSYGFRPRRSCQNAIAQSFIRLRDGKDTWVLEAQIKGFFDNIAHESILKQLGSFPKRDLIQTCLKVGYVLKGELNPTETGTPLVGVISPLLANIGLHGLEQFVKTTNSQLGIVRYADDFIVTARDKGSLELEVLVKTLEISCLNPRAYWCFDA